MWIESQRPSMQLPNRNITRVLAGLLALLVAAIAVAGCGGDDDGLLPGDDAQEIIANLDRIEQLATDGDCAAAETAIGDVRRQVQNLPDFVSDRLQENLMTGIRRLGEVVSDNCPDHDIEAEADTDLEVPEDEVESAGNGDGAGDETDPPERRDRPDRRPEDEGTGRDTEAPDTPGRGRATQPPPAQPGPADGTGRGSPRTPTPPLPDDSGGISPGETGSPEEAGP